jgi:peptidoglycan hydrolase-like protein with peptidoglycan-binding domain
MIATAIAVVAGLVAGPGVGTAPAAHAAAPAPHASVTVMAAVSAPGDVLFRPGDSGKQVRIIQARLRQIGWFSGDVTGYYGPRAKRAVSGFQAKRGIAVTGTVTRRTLTLLEGMTRTPTAAELANRVPRPGAGTRLDKRCLVGRVLCVDKTSRSLRWVVDGKVGVRLDARFGAPSTPTREGRFTVYLKSRDHVSSLFGSSMPFAMFFSGGQAIHYSPDFAAVGYAGASHGCVNIRDYAAIARLFDRVRVGDTVVVYRS